MEEISLISRPVLTVPNVRVVASDTFFTNRAKDGTIVEVVGRTFGTAANIRRNEFNKRIVYSLSKASCKVYYYICFNLNYNYNIIELKHLNIAKETSLSIRSVPTAIEELLTKEVIFKTSRTSLYVVNPKCITNCSVADFEKAYNDFSNKYDVRFNDNNELIYTKKL